MECFRGNGQLDPTFIADTATCSTYCNGDITALCGGGWRLKVYERSEAIPPIQVVEGGRIPTLPVGFPPRNQMTPAGAQTSALVDSGWASRTVTSASVAILSEPSKIAADPTTCNRPCAGQQSLVCGGGWRLTVYQKNQPVPGGQPVPEVVPGWRYQSCYIDSETRTLNGAAFQNTQAMTAGRCAQLCCGWHFFGVQYGQECFCGNTLNMALAAPATDCTSACAGNNSYVCGGGWRLSVYEDLPGDASGCTSSCDGTRLCDQAGCQGSFDMDTGVATCKVAFKGCRCVPQPSLCGSPQMCDVGGCAGDFDSNGRATCRGRFATCPCIPTASMCGPRQDCDSGNCKGRFTGNDPYPHCTDSWASCERIANPQTCGVKQRCDLDGCHGMFDIHSLVPLCRFNFRGCECIPTDETCGNDPQPCSSNSCGGTRDGDGVWRCKHNFGGCKCYVNVGWGFAGDLSTISLQPIFIYYSNDNECQNVPAGWNDRITSF